MNKRIAVLGATLFAVSMTTSIVASPIDTEKYLTVDTVETYEMVDGQAVLIERHSLDGVAPALAEKAKKKAKISLWPKKEEPKRPPSEIETVIILGEKIWNFIEKNKPVVNQRYAPISAVPVGVTSWEELEGWSMPQIRMFKNIYKNVYGMKVVEFNYRVAYAFGGSYKGIGKYLSRVEVDPSLVDVAWGYKFNANGQVLSTTNAGTSENPIAAMELRLNWSVGTVIKHTEQSIRLFISGDGLFKDVSDGTLPSDISTLR